jgi:hypothetical protein
MTNEGKKLQENNIKEHYKYLLDEKVVTSKDVAFEWIKTIGIGYDGAQSIGELMAVIDELVAYAMLGKESPE